MSETYCLLNERSGQYLWIGQCSNGQPDKFYLYADSDIKLSKFIMIAYEQKAILRVAKTMDYTPDEGYYEVVWDAESQCFIVDSGDLASYPECFEQIEGKWQIKKSLRLEKELSIEQCKRLCLDTLEQKKALIERIVEPFQFEVSYEGLHVMAIDRIHKIRIDFRDNGLDIFQNWRTDRDSFNSVITGLSRIDLDPRTVVVDAQNAIRICMGKVEAYLELNPQPVGRLESFWNKLRGN